MILFNVIVVFLLSITSVWADKSGYYDMSRINNVKNEIVSKITNPSMSVNDKEGIVNYYRSTVGLKTDPSQEDIEFLVKVANDQMLTHDQRNQAIDNHFRKALVQK